MKLRNKTVIRWCACVLSVLFRALFATLRVRIRCGSQGPVPYGHWGDQRFLMCMWHDAIAGTIFGGRSQHLAALVSGHADGGYVADALKVLKIRPIRGSSSHGGAAALREMIEAASDHHVAIATDGPRGPRHEVKQGIVYLASVTGRGIVPIAFACQSAWHLQGRWTDLVVPKPFSTVWLVSEEPLYVPYHLDRDELEVYRAELQQRMDALNQWADDLAAGEIPDSDAPLVIAPASTTSLRPNHTSSRTSDARAA
ncbi:MAG: lysophospholipid acyltransferase family protein [Planctomycetaceae bacterium]|nr:lysophospholipid acyltransferase family protein [Planctomycetaceae bacterium]